MIAGVSPGGIGPRLKETLRLPVAVVLLAALLALSGTVMEQATKDSVVLAAPPDRPTNLLPVDNATEVSLNPTLKCTDFSDPHADNHTASQWQIAVVSDNYSTAVFDSGTDNISLTQISVPAGVLTDNSTYYWHVRHQDHNGEWSEWSEETSFHVLNHAPSQPVNESPAGAAEGVSLNPTLKSSGFQDTDSGDTHSASRWRLTSTSGDYSAPLFDSGTDNVSLTQIAVRSGILEEEITYYWQVQHQDSHGAWSDWSVETSFRTGKNRAPSQPTLTSPPGGATDATIPVKLETSVFSDPDENDTHSATRWQIAKTESDFANAICDRIEMSGETLTSLTVDLGVLKPGTTYFWRVQHRDNHGAWSEWSAQSSFTPENRPPAKPSGLSPASGTTAVSLTPTLEVVFSDPDGNDDIKITHWQVSTAQGSYDAPLFDSTSAGTRITVPAGFLNINTTYYWRVRYQDVQNEWSDWSDEASFTTRPALPPVDEGGGIPFWVWVVVGVAGAGVIAGVVLWRVRSGGQK